MCCLFDETRRIVTARAPATESRACAIFFYFHFVLPLRFGRVFFSVERLTAKSNNPETVVGARGAVLAEGNVFRDSPTTQQICIQGDRNGYHVSWDFANIRCVMITYFRYRIRMTATRVQGLRPRKRFESVLQNVSMTFLSNFRFRGIYDCRIQRLRPIGGRATGPAKLLGRINSSKTTYYSLYNRFIKKTSLLVYTNQTLVTCFVSIK